MTEINYGCVTKLTSVGEEIMAIVNRGKWLKEAW